MSALVPRSAKSGDIIDLGQAWGKFQEFGTRGESLEQLEGNANSTDTQFLCFSYNEMLVQETVCTRGLRSKKLGCAGYSHLPF